MQNELNGGLPKREPLIEDAEYTVVDTTAVNRETWLMRLAGLLRHRFEAAGYTVPQNVRLSCGWPLAAAKNRKHKPTAECWSHTASDGGIFEIFISPIRADGLMVAADAAHELAHATAGIDQKHGPVFTACVRAIGLDGKPTATIPSKAFKQWYEKEIEPVLGPYPHDQLNDRSAGATTGKPKQSTRLVKVECPFCLKRGTPYIVRMSAATLERGAPLCPLHEEPMEAS